MPLNALQQRFAAALKDQAVAAPVASSAGRFGVHRNNVAAGILSVLEARFAVVRQLVGDDFFRGMATEYVAKDPPRSPILMLYGDAFPSFIASFVPALDVPYLADVARLEWLQHEAYHAADAQPIGAAALGQIPPGAIAGVRLSVHPSLRLLASEHPALSIWRMHVAPQPVPTGTLAAGAEYALIVRPALSVETHGIAAGLHHFIAALQSGQPLAAAAEMVLTELSDFDLQTALATLISIGTITGYALPGAKDAR